MRFTVKVVSSSVSYLKICFVYKGRNIRSDTNHLSDGTDMWHIPGGKRPSLQELADKQLQSLE